MQVLGSHQHTLSNLQTGILGKSLYQNMSKNALIFHSKVEKSPSAGASTPDLLASGGWGL